MMDIYNKVSFAIEMIILLSAFTLPFRRKTHFLPKAAVGILVILCLNSFWLERLPLLFVFLHYLVIILLLYCLLEICYEEKTSKKLFALTAAYSVQTVLYIIYTISLYLIRLCLPDTVDFLDPLAYIVVYAVGCRVCFLQFPKRMNENKNYNLDNRIMIVLAACVVLISNLFNILTIQVGIPAYAYELIYKPVSAIPCILILCLQFNLISNQSLLYERNTLEQLLKEKDAQYQLSKENIELIQMKCHDLKYQIEAMRQNRQAVNSEALKELRDSIDIYDGIVKTGNEALDVILTEKSLICEKHKIKITVMLDGSRLNHMNVTDLYCIFGNAIDNAIEAVEKQDDEEKRLISITSSLVGNLFSIKIINYYTGELMLEDGLPVSSKTDKRYHGFGMKSIRYIVEKYNGNASFHNTDDLFTLDILLPLKPSDIQ